MPGETDEPGLQEVLAERRRWFESYFDSKNAMVKRGRPPERWCTCPACGYPTLTVRADFQICSLCSWEDDGQDDPDVGFSGPNGDISLAEARANWTTHLTIYRPESRGYEMSRVRLAVREVAVAAFEAIRKIDYREHRCIRELWRTAGVFTGVEYVVHDTNEA